MIYVNGDSWSQRTPYVDYKDIWPNLLAEKLGMTLFNDSMGCGSNSRIQHGLENYLISEEPPKVIVLALTGHHRIHLPSENMGSWMVGPDIAINERTGEKDETIRNWIYRNSYFELDSVYRYYKIVWTLENLCRKARCPYFIFQAWDSELADLKLMQGGVNITNYVYKFFDTPVTDVNAQRYIRAFEHFAEQSAGWSLQEQPLNNLLNQDDYDDTGHPVHSGHIKIADYIYNQGNTWIKDNKH
jgi:hypothetical protein